jgi:predicted nucleic acid-binding protein
MLPLANIAGAAIWVAAARGEASLDRCRQQCLDRLSQWPQCFPCAATARDPRKDEVIVGDLMLCEVLQGLASERTARNVEALLRRFEIVSIAGDAIAVAGARNFRFLRRRGITVRKTIDLLIGTWCIENLAPLLHNDSDFHPMTRYLGLREFVGREG